MFLCSNALIKKTQKAHAPDDNVVNRSSLLCFMMFRIQPTSKLFCLAAWIVPDMELLSKIEYSDITISLSNLSSMIPSALLNNSSPLVLLEYLTYCNILTSIFF